MQYNNNPNATAARMVANYGRDEARALAVTKAADYRNGRAWQKRDAAKARYWAQVARLIRG